MSRPENPKQCCATCRHARASSDGNYQCHVSHPECRAGIVNCWPVVLGSGDCDEWRGSEEAYHDITIWEDGYSKGLLEGYAGGKYIGYNASWRARRAWRRKHGTA